MKPVNLGIIGFGVIGKAHLKGATGLGEKFNVVAIADPRPEAQKEASDAGVKTLYNDEDQLLADASIEAVVVALPTGVRDAVVLKALRAGKHVLYEKPPAMNAAVIEKYKAMAGDLVVACCSSRMVYGPAVTTAAKFIADGGIGDLRLVRVRATLAAGKSPQKPPPVWRQNFALNGGGILVNWGIYDLNYVLELAGWKLKPKTVLAQTWPVAGVFADRVAPGSNADSHFIALIRCAGGEVITFERGEFTAARTEEQWQLVGTTGAVTMIMHNQKEKQIQVDQANAAEGTVGRILWQGDDNLPTSALHEDFADAIRQHRPPRTDLDKALLMQKIFDAIYASAKSGSAVEI